jgi:hypothetical protein
MHTFYLVESRYFLAPVLMQVFFALITLLITYLSFKVYRIVKNPQARSMGIAFSLIFLSYLVQASINFINMIGINPKLYVVFGIHPLSVFRNQGLYIHMIMMTIGLAFLMYTVFKAKDPSLLWYFILSSFLVFLLSGNKLIGFFMLTSLYLGFLSYHFFLNYRKRRKIAPLFVALGFFFLFLGHVGFSFMATSTLFYIIGHVLDFIGYFFLLYNFYIIRK